MEHPEARYLKTDDMEDDTADPLQPPITQRTVATQASQNKTCVSYCKKLPSSSQRQDHRSKTCSSNEGTLRHEAASGCRARGPRPCDCSAHGVLQGSSLARRKSSTRNKTRFRSPEWLLKRPIITSCARKLSLVCRMGNTKNATEVLKQERQNKI